MRPISIEGFEKPKSVSAGAAPMLQWLKINDLVVDPAYQRPLVGKGRQNVDRIAREFSWSCFAPVVVSPVEGGKFAIIDGDRQLPNVLPQMQHTRQDRVARPLVRFRLWQQAAPKVLDHVSRWTISS
jgi:hypothetical protein